MLPAIGPDAEALGTVPINVPQSIEEVRCSLLLSCSPYYPANASI